MCFGHLLSWENFLCPLLIHWCALWHLSWNEVECPNSKGTYDMHSVKVTSKMFPDTVLHVINFVHGLKVRIHDSVRCFAVYYTCKVKFIVAGKVLKKLDCFAVRRVEMLHNRNLISKRNANNRLINQQKLLLLNA